MGVDCREGASGSRSRYRGEIGNWLDCARKEGAPRQGKKGCRMSGVDEGAKTATWMEGLMASTEETGP